ncbi:hypothetical protein BC833DRAFT_582371 [Globomyces pollinis-pini]|nr:hypothetical protein BC833DRAFT_582371 [Globomyces pollinis-pini]
MNVPEELLSCYSQFKFGNIKAVDRTLYFPESKITGFGFPWVNDNLATSKSESNLDQNHGIIVFGSVPVNEIPIEHRYNNTNTQTISHGSVKNDTHLKTSNYPLKPTTNGISSQPAPTQKLWSALLKTDEVPSLPSETSSTKQKLPQISKPTQPIELWKSISLKNKGPLIIPRGLINNGNMCFMNAILQPLIHCPPFYVFFLELSKHTTHNFTSKTPILDAMIDFTKQFHHGSEPDAEQDSAFEAEFVYDAIRLRTKIDSLKGRQEDAEEFLGFLLDGIHEELLLTVDKPLVAIEKPNDDWIEVGKKNKTVTTQRIEIQPSQITRLFGGQLRSIVKSVGSKESITLEPFQSLQLDITDSHVQSIEDAIQNMTKSEVLDDFATHNNSTTTKQSFFEAVPPILIISLKRFVYDINIGKTQKLHKHIHYPIELKFNPSIMTPSPINKQGAQFRLFAVVNHHGKFAQGGHYTCDISHQSGVWYRFDDSSVTVVEEDLVISQQSDRQPYMLFYIQL